MTIVRDFLEKNRKRLHGFRIIICDLDEYDHIHFRMSEKTDFDNFNNVYDQQMLDSDIYDFHIYPYPDPEDKEVYIIADIEL